MSTVYGDSSFLDDTRDYLDGLLTDLVAAMSGSTVPTLLAAYEQHDAIMTSLNCASIGLERVEADPVGLDEGVITNYDMEWSVRVHTAYQGQTYDEQKTTRLMDSVNGYLNTNRKFVDGENFRIISVFVESTKEAFEESYTQGGELRVNIVKTESHTQA